MVKNTIALKMTKTPITLKMAKNPIALKMAKTKSFGHFECNRGWSHSFECNRGWSHSLLQTLSSGSCLLSHIAFRITLKSFEYNKVKAA